MATLQQQLKDAVDAIGQNDIVEFRNHYSGRGMFKKDCIGIVGSMAECMLVIGHVIKEMAEALVSVAKESVDPDYSATPEDLCDTEMLFDQNIDILLNYNIDSMGRQYILYWPALEPI